MYLKTVFLFLISIFFLKVSYSQSPLEFAPVGAKWYYTQPTINPYYTTYTSFESIADTIFGVKKCKIIKEVHRNSPVTADTLLHFIYSDSNKVYVRKDTNWCLLYDFNAQQGDTFHIDCILNFSNPLTVTVLSVDTITINGYKRKLYDYFMSNIVVDFTGKVIEGIGHTLNMFPTLDGQLFGPLRCYQDNDIGIYKNEYYYSSTWLQDCDQIVTGIQAQADDKKINVFPNPATEQLEVSGLKFKVGDAVTVTDLLGREMQTMTVANPISNFKFQISNYPTGVYFVLIRTNNGSVVKQFVKE